jgi:cell division protein FtsB
MGMMSPILIVAVAFWSVVLGTGIYVVRRVLRIMERRVGAEAELSALQQRVATLEESLDDVRGSLDRLELGQEFTTRLLGARSDRGGQTGE